jgi:hypothetical protein
MVNHEYFIKKTHCDTILLESQQDNAEVVKANNLGLI